MPGLPAGMEWVVIAVVALLLFGGTAGARLAGLGKGAGRAIREFKEETQGIKDKEKADAASASASVEAETPKAVSETVDAEVVEPSTEKSSDS